jgi:flavin reductase (DIM6/NTAB) family NADH-FMN oxidoreductase RutF
MSDPVRAYRNVLGCYPTGVAIVTAHAPGGVAAITINSFASVSLEPRLVLWSLGDQSESYPVFSAAKSWGLSILAEGAEAAARKYAEQGRACALEQELETLADTPVFARALAALACRTHERRTLGDHLVIVGEVVDFRAREGDALTFYRGRFGSAG